MLQDMAVDADQRFCEPSRDGIRLCLRMLADEAATLRMPQTVKAIRAALRVCELEKE